MAAQRGMARFLPTALLGAAEAHRCPLHRALVLATPRRQVGWTRDPPCGSVSSCGGAAYSSQRAAQPAPATPDAIWRTVEPRHCLKGASAPGSATSKSDQLRPMSAGGHEQVRPKPSTVGPMPANIGPESDNLDRRCSESARIGPGSIGPTSTNVASKLISFDHRWPGDDQLVPQLGQKWPALGQDRAAWGGGVTHILERSLNNILYSSGTSRGWRPSLWEVDLGIAHGRPKQWSLRTSPDARNAPRQSMFDERSCFRPRFRAAVPRAAELPSGRSLPEPLGVSASPPTAGPEARILVEAAVCRGRFSTTGHRPTASPRSSMGCLAQLAHRGRSESQRVWRLPVVAISRSRSPGVLLLQVAEGLLHTVRGLSARSLDAQRRSITPQKA